MKESSKEIILTKEGYEQLIKEREYLINIKRKEIAEKIAESIHAGDLNDSPEYDEAKNEQARIEDRIATINEILSRAKVIDEEKIKFDKVCAGARVVLKDLNEGIEEEYKIVGSAESNPLEGKISNESPIGSAIMGKRAGEIVEVNAPQGTSKYKITSIKR